MISFEIKENEDKSFKIILKDHIYSAVNLYERDLNFNIIDNHIKSLYNAEIRKYILSELFKTVDLIECDLFSITFQEAMEKLNFSCLTDMDNLVYHYISNTVGEGWGLHNIYKLKSDYIIDMWLFDYLLKKRLYFGNNEITKNEIHKYFIDGVTKIENAFKIQ